MPVSVTVLTDCEATTAVDNFNYTTSPLAISTNDGSWTDAVITGDTFLQADGTQAIGATAVGQYSGYKNNSGPWGPNFVVMATLSARTDGDTGNADGTAYLYILEGAGLGSGSPDGYIGEWRLRAPGTAEFRIKRLEAGIETATLSSGTLQEDSTGDKWALVRNGNDLEIWWKTGSTWTFMASATDSTYTANKRIGLLTSISSIVSPAYLDDLKAMNIVTAAAALGAPSPPVTRVRLRAY